MTIATTRQVDIPTGVWTLDPSHSRAYFVARHMVVTKVRGELTKVEGRLEVADDLTQSSVEVAFATDSLTTGATDRDQHLKSGDFFDVATYPEVRFVSSSVAPKGDRWLLTGDLTIKDVTRPVTIDFTFHGTETSPFGKTVAAFSGKTELNREDWGLTWNVALESGGWLVSKKVEIEIEVEAFQA